MVEEILSVLGISHVVLINSFLKALPSQITPLFHFKPDLGAA